MSQHTKQPFEWEKASHFIALGLVAICFVFSLSRVFKLTPASSLQGKTEILIGHWQLESSVREAFDLIIAEYEKQNPNITIRQIPIPERVYAQWFTTQLVGGMAPDIVQIGIGSTPDKLARYMLPLTKIVNLPNPYNRGTELENTPWRETIIDGMAGYNSFNPTLLEYYGIPVTMFTTRIYYNKQLLQAITGSDITPKTFEEFIAICEKARQWSHTNNRPIIPIAGSEYNAPYIINSLSSAITMRFKLQFDTLKQGDTSIEDLFLAYLQDQWTIDDPTFRASMQIKRDIGQYMQSGFMQNKREDATFRFIQGQALMIASGAWDSTTLITQAPFPVGIFPLPYPSTNHPTYGPFVRGPQTEANTDTGLALGIARNSKNPDLAIDFLQFLSSQQQNQTFVNHTKWLPAVIGVTPYPGTEPFMPIDDGYVTGISLPMGSYEDTRRTLEKHQHELLSPVGSVDQYLQTLRGSLRQAIENDLRRVIKDRNESSRRFDAPSALHHLQAHTLEGEDRQKAESQFERMIESQIGQAMANYWLQSELERITGN